MNAEQFKAVYDKFRNGTDNFHFNPLYRNFLYSDGVKELAETGCYWLLDLLGTELDSMVAPYMSPIVQIKVKGGKADLEATWADDEPPRWARHIDYTDMPEGEWTLYISDDGDGKRRCILPTEY